MSKDILSMNIHVIDNVEDPKQFPIATIPIVGKNSRLIDLILSSKKRKNTGENFSMVTKYFVEEYKLKNFNTIYATEDVHGIKFTYLTLKQLRMLILDLVDEKNLHDSIAISYLSNLGKMNPDLKFVIELT